MNKTILALLTACAISTTATASAQDNKSQQDSIGYYIGATQGLLFNNNLSGQSPQYRADFLEGISQTLVADTTRRGLLDGMRIGIDMIGEIRRMAEAGQAVDREMMLQAFSKYFNTPDADQKEYQQLYNTLVELMEPTRAYYEAKQNEARRREEAAHRNIVETNKAAGEKFLTELKASNKNIKETESGLLYEIVKEGNGPTLGENQRARVRYTGRLVNGQIFDSSGDKTYDFAPSQVIAGFGEGLKLMNKGSKFILYIPYNLAYGLQGPPAIGPAQTLIFEVECEDIVPEPKP